MTFVVLIAVYWVKSSDCNSRSKGVKCFNCNEFGHKAPVIARKKKLGRRKKRKKQ